MDQIHKLTTYYAELSKGRMYEFPGWKSIVLAPKISEVEKWDNGNGAEIINKIISVYVGYLLFDLKAKVQTSGMDSKEVVKFGVNLRNDILKAWRNEMSLSAMEYGFQMIRRGTSPCDDEINSLTYPNIMKLFSAYHRHYLENENRILSELKRKEGNKRFEQQKKHQETSPEEYQDKKEKVLHAIKKG